MKPVEVIKPFLPSKFPPAQKCWNGDYSYKYWADPFLKVTPRWEIQREIGLWNLFLLTVRSETEAVLKELKIRGAKQELLV